MDYAPGMRNCMQSGSRKDFPGLWPWLENSSPPSGGRWQPALRQEEAKDGIRTFGASQGWGHPPNPLSLCLSNSLCAAGGNYLQTALRLFGSACRMPASPPRGCSWAIEFRNKGQQHPRRRMQGIGIMSPYFPISHSPATRCAEVYAATSAAASEKLTIVCFS